MGAEGWVEVASSKLSSDDEEEGESAIMGVRVMGVGGNCSESGGEMGSEGQANRQEGILR